jgi:hypothetical protein
MSKKWGRRRDDSGSMLASVIVIVIGTGICCFMCVMADSRYSDLAMGAVVVSAFLVLASMIWYRYSSGDGSGRLAFWNAAARNNREDGLAAQYRPRKVEDRRSQQQPGSNRPITAQEAHDLQINSSKTWVQSKARVRKK